MRPQLPQADRLLPYLCKIDSSRIYANHGPLASELECRLADLFGFTAGCVVCACSGTAALVGAILASVGRAKRDRPLALTPSFTFVATASALESCGYQPYLVDIDPVSWALDPERLVSHPLLNRVGVVVPVAPFGRPVAQAPWRAFTRTTGIKVVIDGAAAFDTVQTAPEIYLGDIPVAFSFHATKSFGAGEGGAVAATDIALLQRTTQALNFGFFEMRDSRTPSINGKMSEYHAAVGLAELDGWVEKQSALFSVIECYRRVTEEARLSDHLYVWPDISTSYVLFLCHEVDQAATVQECLSRSGIDFRLWYGTGLHRQTYFSDLAHDDLDVTDAIAPCGIGLPVAPDLAEASIHHVIVALTEGVRNAPVIHPIT
jgi:dTDP-4-amino-4,6-dideoxygalactose transaminase